MPTAPAPKKLPAWQQAIVDNILDGVGEKVRASLGPKGIADLDRVMDKVEETVAKWPPTIPDAVKQVMLKAEQAGAAITRIARDGVPPLPVPVVQLVDAGRQLTERLKLRVDGAPPTASPAPTSPTTPKKV